MKKLINTILCFAAFFPPSFSQYFQQHVSYNINVSLDDVRHELHAFIQIQYTNNSPQPLSQIWFHLWPNAYKDNNTAFAKQKIRHHSTRFFFAPDSLRGFIDSLDFKINGIPARFIPDSLNPDIALLSLNEPLAPGQSVTITTPFRVKIPSASFSRLGHTGQAYFITQWYPKPAVFDQLGWHPIPYLDQGEFYSEWGDFQVSITLPANYVVGASGELQNPAEIEWLNLKARQTDSILSFPSSMAFPPSDSQTKTLTYKASPVHDFAWFADKRFHVLKSQVELPHSKNSVTTWAMFTNAQANWWRKAPLYINNALHDYSLWNGDYPYNNCTAIDGTIAAGGGMEYPMITIIGSASSEFELEDVIVHEVGHNWFYGILGSNERDHGWMDEGINSFNEMRYVMTRYPADKDKNDISNYFGAASGLFGTKNLSFKNAWELEYLLAARLHRDQPVDLTSDQFLEFNYGVIMYRKTALVFDHLKSYLGDSLFDRCMQQYYKEWKFRHPYPDDLRAVFESQTGKNLGWFFNDLIASSKKADYAISGIRPLKAGNLVNPSSKSYGITVRNKGQITLPFSYSALQNGIIQSTRWEEGFEGTKTFSLTCSACDEIRLDAIGSLPDLNRRNNSIRTNGLLRKTEKLQFHFPAAIENPQRTQVFAAPVIGWNNYNKTMPGLALHNKFFPNKKFEYVLVPMYATSTRDFAGTANLSFTLFPSQSFLHHITLTASFSHFASDRPVINLPDFTGDVPALHFTTLPVDLYFDIRKGDVRSPVQWSFRSRSINTWQEELYYDKGLFRQNQYLFYHQAVFNVNNSRTFDPFNASLTLENGTNYMKAMTEFNYLFSFRNVSRGVNIRWFAGAFLFNNEEERNYNFRMSAWRGYHDYLYDDIYLGRNESDGFFARQTCIHDGGFKIYSPVGQSGKWITSLNVMVDLPKLPLRLFLDAGTYKGAADAFEGSKALMYDGGISLSLIRNIAEVYVPLFKSSDIKQSLQANDIPFKEQIRFMLNFKLMNPFRLRDSVLK